MDGLMYATDWLMGDRERLIYNIDWLIYDIGRLIQNMDGLMQNMDGLLVLNWRNNGRRWHFWVKMV